MMRSARWVCLLTLVLVGPAAGGVAWGGGLRATVQTDDVGTVTTYADPATDWPGGIAEGPDGAMWFTNALGDSIGRITTYGAVTTYTDPTIGEPVAIAAGPDGAMWFTNVANNSIGRITMDGTITNFTDPTIRSPGSITAGPDGAMWFTDDTGIGRITMDGAVTGFTDPGISNAPTDIAAGPDGALWFTMDGNGTGDSIGSITTGGAVTIYSDSSIRGPTGITQGPDGAMWFSNRGNGLEYPSSIGRITTDGSVTTFQGPAINGPESIAEGPDGALWFTNDLVNSIGRITTDGTATSYTIPNSPRPSGIAEGTDGAMWFTLSQADLVARITALGDPSAPAISSSDGATFPVGVPTSLAVSATGAPAPALIETGALPSGVTFVDNGDGTATLSGTPATGTGGTYPIVITADNGVIPNAAQDVVLYVPETVAITSVDQTDFTQGQAGTFTVAVRGYPSPVLSEAGTLPTGITLTSAGVLSGTTIQSGTFPIVLTASNGVSPDATQSFTLTVATLLQISTSSLPNATPGQAYGPVQLQTIGALPGASLRWKKAGSLPRGLKVSSSGILSGVPSAKLVAGSDLPVPVQVTEEVVTYQGRHKHTTKTTVSTTLTVTIS